MNALNPKTDHTRNLPTGPPQRTQQIVDDLVVRFEPGFATLRASETDVIRRWVDTWQAQDDDAMVVMACNAPSARSARVERLRMLRAVLARNGVALDRVRYSGDLIEASAQDVRLSDAVAGTATLKVVRARRAEREVRSIRSYFRAIGSRKGLACTSAS